MANNSLNPLELLQPIIFMLITGLLILILLRQALILSRAGASQKKLQPYTLESCGDKVERRPFKEGDYVGLITGECEGGVPKRIIGIYVDEAPKESV
ncbi:MAG: hypothetical protein P3X22_003565 [Thermoprotei archaeon]|nr:hypothetical protein [Thermoprotei archaeon]